MNGKIDLTDLFFSADGRIDRVPFIGASVALLALYTLYGSLANQNDAVHWVTGIVAYPFLIFTGVCVLSKRLHDRGRSGWWALVTVLCIALVIPYPKNPWDWLAFAFLIWAGVELLLMPGEQGANRFGPSPRPN